MTSFDKIGFIPKMDRKPDVIFRWAVRTWMEWLRIQDVGEGMEKGCILCTYEGEFLGWRMIWGGKNAEDCIT